MNIARSIKEAELKSIESDKAYMLPFDFSRKTRNKYLRLMVAEKDITTDELNSAIKTSLMNTAKSLYTMSIRKNRDPEHLHPEIIAYGIENGVISKEEAERMPVGTSIDDFCKTYRNTRLVEDIREKLLTQDKDDTLYDMPHF